MNRTLAIVLVVLVIVGIAGCSTLSGGYNTMVNKQEVVKAQWGQVNNVYQRRADLIPNLVNTAKGYAKFEQSTLTDIANARAKVGQVNIGSEVPTDPAKLKAFQDAQQQLGSSIGRLLAVSENYPDLKANENFHSLVIELEGSENRINFERNKFNTAAQDFNTYIRSFPHNIFAGIFGFHATPYFEAAAGSEKAPVVSF